MPPTFAISNETAVIPAASGETDVMRTERSAGDATGTGAGAGAGAGAGSGVGVDITANKFHNVRSALADDVATAKQSREHDNTNVLSLPSDEVDSALAQKIVSAWLSTPFSGGEKHKRRIDKME